MDLLQEDHVFTSAETNFQPEAIENALKQKLFSMKNLVPAIDKHLYFYGSKTEAQTKFIERNKLKLQFGFKIHIPIFIDHPDFIKVTNKVIEICDVPNRDGLPTSFKIVKPTQPRLDWLRVDENKGIVIYPNLLITESKVDNINWTEPNRIGSLLQECLTKITGYENMQVKTDIKLPSGIFVRYGALHIQNWGNDDHTASFWTNLSRLKIPIKMKNQVINLLGSKRINPPQGWEDKQVEI